MIARHTLALACFGLAGCPAADGGADDATTSATSGTTATEPPSTTLDDTTSSGDPPTAESTDASPSWTTGSSSSSANGESSSSSSSTGPELCPLPTMTPDERLFDFDIGVVQAFGDVEADVEYQGDCEVIDHRSHPSRGTPLLDLLCQYPELALWDMPIWFTSETEEAAELYESLDDGTRLTLAVHFHGGGRVALRDEAGTLLYLAVYATSVGDSYQPIDAPDWAAPFEPPATVDIGCPMRESAFPESLREFPYEVSLDFPGGRLAALSQTQATAEVNGAEYTLFVRRAIERIDLGCGDCQSEDAQFHVVRSVSE